MNGLSNSPQKSALFLIKIVYIILQTSQNVFSVVLNTHYCSLWYSFQQKYTLAHLFGNLYIMNKHTD
ncbi:hypothetical protein J2Y60_001797 [Arcicella sp. BE140]|nr:hypothetical protein [Arcicella sp. BE51]MDR6811599.1 hypothetical protein [Arcicella sp. BE140]MDR6823125.1 hypothetical protein [Arcicella sp. BE139]